MNVHTIRRNTLSLFAISIGLSLGVATLVVPRSAQAGVYTVIVEKEEQRKKSRWSLSEWLDTRDRMRLMDLWLALHSPSPFEFFFGGHFQYSFPTGAASFMGGQGHVGAYMSIFGVQAQWEGLALPTGLSHRVLSEFNFRVLGAHYQATHWTFHLGFRQAHELGEWWRQATLGTSMTWYLAKPFGIEPAFRYHFGSTPTATGESVKGYHLAGGMFIEFKWLRLYGQYFWEPEIRTTDVGSVRTNRHNVAFGTKIFL